MVYRVSRKKGDRIGRTGRWPLAACAAVGVALVAGAAAWAAVQPAGGEWINQTYTPEPYDPADLTVGVIQDWDETIGAWDEQWWKAAKPLLYMKLLEVNEYIRAEHEVRPERSLIGAPEDEGGVAGGGSPFTVGVAFDAADQRDNGAFPPDTMGAIGPTHFVEIVNFNVSIFDRATGQRVSSQTLQSFWSGLWTGAFPFDPRVLYDRDSGRFIHICADNPGGQNHILLAVSMTSDPTGPWFKTRITASQGGDAGRWIDYPMLGVDENAVYVSGNMFPIGGGGAASTIWVIEKAPLVDDPPQLGNVTAFRGIGSAFSIQPAHNFDSGTPEYFAARNLPNEIRLFRVTGAPNNPSLTLLGDVQVSPYDFPDNARARGSGEVDTLDARLMMAVHRDGRLFTSHGIFGGIGAACRWYEIDPLTLTLIQEGTVSSDTRYYYFPAVMVNGLGHVAMGFSGSNSSEYVACYYSGRLATDPPGTMSAPELLRSGGAGYTQGRWGDYSYTTLDPLDDMTFWTIQEYMTNSFNVWGTYVAELRMPAPTVDSVDPPSGSAGQTLDVTIHGSGFHQYNNLLTVEFLGGDVTVNSIALVDPSAIDANITIASNASSGPRDVRVTNPDGQEGTGVGVFTITGGLPGDFDGDGDVDIADFSFFSSCFTGSGVPCSGDCCAADLDGDGDVDIADFSIFSANYTGSL